MAEHIVFHPQLTKADALILESLRQDIKEYSPQKQAEANATARDGRPSDLQATANGKASPDLNGAYNTTQLTFVSCSIINEAFSPI